MTSFIYFANSIDQWDVSIIPGRRSSHMMNSKAFSTIEISTRAPVWPSIFVFDLKLAQSEHMLKVKVKEHFVIIIAPSSSTNQDVCILTTSTHPHKGAAPCTAKTTMEQASTATEVEAEHQPLLQSIEQQQEELPQTIEALWNDQTPQADLSIQSTELAVAEAAETAAQSVVDRHTEISGSAEVSVVSTDAAEATSSSAVTPSNLAEVAASTMQTVIERGSTLLREWESNNATSTTAEPTTSMGSPHPVVAPAVVLNEASGDSNTTPGRVGVYPVATFVSNLVRTSVNEIRSHIPTVAVNPNHHHHDDAMSLRSEPVGSMDILNDRNPSVADSSMTDQEFVLIDGDLVAIPASHLAPPPAPAQAERDYSRSENNIHHLLQQEHRQHLYSWHPFNYHHQQQQQQPGTQNQQQQ